MWTYRMTWMPGGEWGFKQMTEQLVVFPTAAFTFTVEQVQQRVQAAQSQMDERKRMAFTQHCMYWDNSFRGQYEHWRFELGYSIGFTDAMSFFSMRSGSHLQGGDKIGMLELWVLKRIRESGQVGKFVWEFEAGLRQGIKGFDESIGL